MIAPLIGIVGAYGETGAVVARTLAAQGNAPLRLIGRNESKLEQLDDSLAGPVTHIIADVMDHESLSAACQGCHTIVNCAAPASQIGDRVARVAFESGSHYVNPGLDPHENEWLHEHEPEIKSKGLVYLLGAGYVPGLSEMMMRAIYEVHRGKTTLPCNVQLVVVDRNEWSLNGIIDIVEHFCRHPPEIGVYKQGTFVRRSMLTAWTRRRMPNQPSAEVLMPVRWPEVEQFVSDVKPAEASVYMPMDPLIYFVGRFFAIFAPSRMDLAARVAKAIFHMKSKREGAGGILYAEGSGRKGHQPERWLVEVPEGRHYERTGQVAALATSLVVDGTLAKPGVQYLAHAVDPHEFIVRLRVWGVEVIELTAQDMNENRPNAR